jgi:hypothetical protein
MLNPFDRLVDQMNLRDIDVGDMLTKRRQLQDDVKELDLEGLKASEDDLDCPSFE